MESSNEAASASSNGETGETVSSPTRITIQTKAHLLPDEDDGDKVLRMRDLICQHFWVGMTTLSLSDTTIAPVSSSSTMA